MFDSVDDVQKRLLDQNYIAGKKIATVVYLASKLNKPVLVEGPAGVGKTELAKVVARAVGRQLIRLQCYEGLEESKALYEWEYSKQLLYTQMLRDKISDVIAGTKTLKEASERIAGQDDVFFSERFIVARPLLKAITSPEPICLLIDEVDKSDPEFEAFLLEVLSDYTVSVPEVGTIQAKHLPLVFLTSNDAREMTDALKRRCLHLHIDFPSTEEAVRILEPNVPGLGDQLVHDIVAPLQPSKARPQETPSIRRHGLGARAHGLERRRARGRAGERHVERDPEAPGRHREGAERAECALAAQGGRKSRGRAGHSARRPSDSQEERAALASCRISWTSS
jgi:MoxR-like ATPase